MREGIDLSIEGSSQGMSNGGVHHNGEQSSFMLVNVEANGFGEVLQDTFKTGYGFICYWAEDESAICVRTAGQDKECRHQGGDTGPSSSLGR